METKGQSRKWDFKAKEKTVGTDRLGDSATQLLPTHYPALLPACLNCVSRDKR